MKRLFVFVFAVVLFSSCIKSRAKSIEGTYSVYPSIFDISGHSVFNFDNSECIVEIQKERYNKALVIASFDDSVVFNEELKLSRDRYYPATWNFIGFFGTKRVYYESTDRETSLYCKPNLGTGELYLSFYNDLGMSINLNGNRIE